MEFKVQCYPGAFPVLCVDIGTEWNLKGLTGSPGSGGGRVDIGTEWNLKADYAGKENTAGGVDIGTEWNLKGLRA